MLSSLRQFVLRLPVAQRVIIASVFVGGVLVLAGVGYWASRPDYALLFARLSPADAGRIVDALRDEGVRYQLKEGGTAVFVPRDKVYDLRLQFAAQSIGGDTPSGYELFDNGSLGMTDFMQKLNLKRALEGELSRTISSLRQVDVARVHLVIPERSPFREASTDPTASVVIRFAGSERLSASQISGIAGLVSGAVEGLTSDKVTVLDTGGNLLSNAESADPDLALSATQLRVTKALEEHLTTKGQSMLDQFLGPGNAIVRVSARLDFNKSVSETSRIDPESATVVSEERVDQQGGEETNNSTLRNYELTRTRERSEKAAYEISDLSVSLVLNQLPAPNADDDAPVAFQEYDATQLQRIEDIVKSAVGFSTTRGDRFAVHQSPFDTSGQDYLANEIASAGRSRTIQTVARYLIMLIALLVGAWFLRGSLSTVTRLSSEMAQRAIEESKQNASRLNGQAVGEPGSNGLDGGAEIHSLPGRDMYTSKLSPEAQARLQAKNMMFDEIIEQVSENPEEVAELMRAWIADDKSREHDRNRDHLSAAA